MKVKDLLKELIEYPPEKEVIFHTSGICVYITKVTEQPINEKKDTLIVLE
jgi:hypothetical protein